MDDLLLEEAVWLDLRVGERKERVSAGAVSTRADLVEIAAGPCTSVIEIGIAGMILRVPPARSPDDLRSVLTVVKSC